MKNYTRIITSFFLFLLLSTPLIAQEKKGTIIGVVIDEATSEILISATVLALDETNKTVGGVVTDINGHFSLSLPPNKYKLECSYVGHQSYQVNIEIKAGAIFDIGNIKLNQSPTPGVMIYVEPSPKFHNTATLTPKDIDRLPAVYDDPGRSAALLSGVLNSNDQTNGISVRGNNPNGVKWYLEGIELPNPNHTPNAGTASDRITSGSGGVNMIKSSFLGSTDFYHGSGSPRFGNALGGVLSMNLDKTQYKENSFGFQIGLIGLDAMAKGKIGKDIYYNANLRYSTVGLLTNILGLDFGGEKISFMDNNISISKGNFTIFNINGISNNVFEAQRDTANWGVEKDRFDIDFNSTTSITGITYLNETNIGTFNTTLAYSRWNSVRTAHLLDNNFNETLTQKDSLRHQRLSFRTLLTNHDYRIRAELKATYLDYELHNFDSLANFQANGRQKGWLLQPNINKTFFLRKNMSGSLGLHSMYFTENNTWAIEPRLEVRVKNLILTVGTQSQMQDPSVYLSKNSNGERINKDLKLTKSHHYNITYASKKSKYRPRANNYAFQAYYQDLFNVPILNTETSSFSVLNDLNSFITDSLTNDGFGRNFGFEMEYSHSFRSKNYQLLKFNLSLYQSQYQGGDGIWRNTRYNGNYILNVLFNKEWKLYKRKRVVSSKNTMIGLYIRGLYAGGFRKSPIDLALSQSAGRTVFVESEAFSERQGDVIKIDLRFYWKKEVFKVRKSKQPHQTTYTFALDIQNMTNQKNEAFNYFDPLQGKIITKYQLGLIPLLSFRMEF